MSRKGKKRGPVKNRVNKVRLNLGKRSYSIYIGKGAVKKIKKFISAHFKNTPIFIITNRKIFKLHGKKILSAIGSGSAHINKAANKKFTQISDNCWVFLAEDSEKAKSFATYVRITDKLVEIGKRSKPLVIAFGGGVIGDLSGFVASTYRRGVPYIQVPTTLLAQVDSSIGGKVALDLPRVKNIIGSFYQPAAVFSDITLLKTLPPKEVINGLGEIIKYGVLKGRGLFNKIYKDLSNLKKLNVGVLENVVTECSRIKAKIVREDEFDQKDIRATLNLGHTFAHAIESTRGYSKIMTHGEAVACGIVMAAHLAHSLKKISSPDRDKICGIIKKSGVSLKFNKHDAERIADSMNYYRKFISGKSRLVLPIAIGKVRIFENIPAKEITKSILKT